MNYKFSVFFSLFVLSIFFIGCSKNKDSDNGNSSQNDSTALLGILQDISKDYKTMIDIAPVPIDQELVNLNNDTVDMFLDMLRKLNDLIKNPQNVEGAGHKSAASGTFTKNCETTGGFTECIYEEDHGEYKITVDMISGPYGISISTYYTGTYQGVFYGNMYEKESYVAPIDGNSFMWTTYRDPVPTESAGEPEFSYSMIFSDDWTVYTPWGNEHNLHVEVTSIVYLWDDFKKKNHEELILKHKMEGDLLKMMSAVWSVNLEDVFVNWIGTYNFKEHSGQWCSFDEDGEVKNCGPL